MSGRMSTPIHPLAVVEAGAELGAGVTVGPFAFVGAGVRLGEGTVLHHHSSVEGNTVLGRNCEVFAYANLGAKTQDLKFKGGSPGVRIGDRNVFREYASVHAATADGHHTTVGDGNTILAYCHIAHDCVLGNGIVMSNIAMLAGHVTVEDHVVIGGYAGVHQFCRVGAYAMVGAKTKLVQDLPPFFIADGRPAGVRAYNKVGLVRNGFTPAQLARVREIFRVFYREGLNRTQALERLAAHPDAGSDEIRRVLEFAQKSKRGLLPGATGLRDAD
jgi:UDP-N-acetylglucosamine acyltransferase